MTPRIRASGAWPVTIRTANRNTPRRSTTQNATRAIRPPAFLPAPRSPARSRLKTAPPVTCPSTSCRVRIIGSPIIESGSCKRVRCIPNSASLYKLALEANELGAGQQSARNRLGVLTFQTATGGAAAALHNYPSPCVVDAIDCACAVVRLERGQRPIGISEHVDAALGSHQDGEIRRIGSCLGGTLGCLQNRSRILEKGAHE